MCGVRNINYVAYLNHDIDDENGLRQAEGRADTRPSRANYRWKRLQDALRRY